MTLGQALVIRGDARRLPLPDGSVDLICCSPPYYSLCCQLHTADRLGGQP